MPIIKTIEMPDDWTPGCCGNGQHYICPFSKRGCWVRLPENCPIPLLQKPEEQPIKKTE